MEAAEFWTVCSTNGIVLEKEQLDGIERYATELLYWNKKVNLISRKDERRVIERHILHSLSLVVYADIPDKARCIDVGSGGGLPGIPLAIARPDLEMLLIDSIRKKANIAEMLASHTGLKKISAQRARAEDPIFQKNYVAYFDVVLARAVASVSKLISWTAKILNPDGKFVFLKGGDLTSEIEEARKKFPGLTVDVKPIKMIGVESFEHADKKVLICKLPKLY